MVISRPSVRVVEKVSRLGAVFLLVAGVACTESSEIVLIGCVNAFVKFYPLFVDSVLEHHVTESGGKGKVNGIGFFPAEFSVIETIHFESVINVVEPKLDTHFAKVRVNWKG
jgi:hypothetical protein